MTERELPRPVPDEASAPFFDGANEGRLMLQHCAVCSTTMWPVKSRCITCFHPDPAWTASSGKATLYTFAVMHQPYHPGFEVPYAIGQVETDEGVRITTSIVNCDIAQLHAGMHMEAVFQDVGGIGVPRFQPVMS